MGWLKRGTDQVVIDGVGGEIGNTAMYPGSGLSVEIKPLLLHVWTISNISGYNECSMSCMRGSKRRPLVSTLSLLSLGGWKCNNYGLLVVPRTGGVPRAL